MLIGSGTRFGSYDVTAKIGGGGMGEVYEARGTDRRQSTFMSMHHASARRNQLIILIQVVSGVRHDASRRTHVFPVFFMVKDNVHGC